MVRIPAVLIVAPVGVHAAEDPVGDRVGDLVMEAMPGQRGVVDLEVHPVLALETMATEEAVNGRAVVVVLVLGRLLGLRLDQKHPLEADLVLMLGHHCQESRELCLLAGEVRVEQSLVTLPAAPQVVVRAAEPLGRLEHRLDLGGRVGEHLRVGVGRGTGRVAGVAEEVGSPPQELHAGPGHVGRGVVDHRLQVRPRFRERPTLRGDVAIVEAVERHAQLGEELEGGVELRLRRDHRVEAGVEPWPVEGSRTEDIRAGPVERVPQTGGDPEVILHPLAEHKPIRLVDLERQGLRRIDPAERDPLRDVGEEAFDHYPILPAPARDRSYQTTRGSLCELITCTGAVRDESAWDEAAGDRPEPTTCPAGSVESGEPR